MKSETKIQHEILRHLNALDNCWAVKIISSNRRGCPDILCCYRGLFIAFEVKTPEGKISGIQEAQATLIEKCYGRVYFVSSKEQVEKAIERFELNKGVV